jgi:hypothetical protein
MQAQMCGNIRMDLAQYEDRWWAAANTVLKLGFYKTWKFSRRTEKLVCSHEGLSSMDLVDLFSWLLLREDNCTSGYV